MQFVRPPSLITQADAAAYGDLRPGEQVGDALASSSAMT